MDKYERLHSLYSSIFTDLRILAGDEVGLRDVTWQDVAGTAATNLRALASFLDALREGATHHQGCPITGTLAFPSPADFADGEAERAALEAAARNFGPEPDDDPEG